MKCKWVFQTKNDANDVVARYKAWLVANITMHYMRNIKGVLVRLDMENCKPIETPFYAKTSLTKLLEEEHLYEMNEIMYQEAVGALMYAMVATRPDLPFAVSSVNQVYVEIGSNELDGS